MAGGDTMKFNYEDIQVSYTKLIDISEKTKEALDRLEKVCDVADQDMKGKYRAGFKDKKDEVFKEVKDVAVDGVRKIAKIMNVTSKDMEKKELEIIQCLEK